MRNTVNIILASICIMLVFSAFRAKDYGIPIKKDQTLLVFGSDDESYRKFEIETLSSKNVKEKMKSMGIEVVIVTKNDTEIAKKYSITKTPSIVLILENSPPKKRDGFMGVKEFMSWLK